LRHAEVQSLFLQGFGTSYTQLKFRGIRRFPDRTHGPYDFALRVTFGRSGHELDLLCVTLTEGFPQDVRRAIEQIHEAEPFASEVDVAPALVVPFMAEEGQALCRGAGVGYFDLAGNAKLDTERIFLHIRGRPNEHARERQITSPFVGKSERVVRRLLLEPSQRWSMRALAQASHVSLGMASMATTALAELGVVTKSRTGLDLFDPTGLLDMWSRHYDLKRSPFRIYRSQRSLSDLMARLVSRHDQFLNRYVLTLWTGANTLLAEPERIPRLALYWMGSPDPLVRALGLNEERGATYVFIFQPYDEGVFWSRRETGQQLLVAHPLQLFLDLNSGDQAELDLARAVRERLLIW
jgi:hypothetical protein